MKLQLTLKSIAELDVCGKRSGIMLSNERNRNLIRTFLLSVSFILFLGVKVEAEVKHSQSPPQHIVGGQEAEPGAWPWMVALATRGIDDFSEAQFCGGSLIHPYWVVTAAHCLDGQSAAEIDVLIGVHDLKQSNSPDVRRIEVVEMLVHPSWEGFSTEGSVLDADIALLRLRSPVMDRAVLPLVHDAGLLVSGKNARALGWGLTSDEGEPSPLLREVLLPLVANSVVDATGAYDSPLSPDVIAAGFKAGGKDSCSGDSGGPLIIQNLTSGTWMLAGVVSFGSDKGCAAADAYGIYSSVPFHFDWLIRMMHSGYAEYASEFELSQVTGDPDSDGFQNFIEYAFDRDPTDRNSKPITSFVMTEFEGESYPAIQVEPVPVRNDIELGLRFSTDLKTWISPVLTDPGTVFRSHLPLMEESRQFLNLQVHSSTDLPLTDFIDTSVFKFKGTLDDSLEKVTEEQQTFFTRTFRLAGLTPGEQAEFQYESFNDMFAPRLKLTRFGSGEVLLEAGSSGQFAMNTTFSPDSDEIYQVQLSSIEPGAGGAFVFNFPPVIEFTGEGGPVLDPFDDPIQGELEDIDDVGEPGEPFILDVYILVGVRSGDRIRITLDSGGAFTPALFILNDADFEVIAEQIADPGESVANVTLDVVEGFVYLISVESESGDEKGSYTLSATLLSNGSL
ncbi:MAG TPA: serine protease [Verrucomicrobiales bacterium]|nr:serine protease [Verrucomicrobiales bacterium]